MAKPETIDQNDGARRGDFREFAFRATGRDTENAPLDPITVQDNLIAELARLRSVANLIGAAKDQIDVEVLGGLSLLLVDIADRMRVVLDAARDDRTRGKDVARGGATLRRGLQAGGSSSASEQPLRSGAARRRGARSGQRKRSASSPRT